MSSVGQVNSTPNTTGRSSDRSSLPVEVRAKDYTKVTLNAISAEDLGLNFSPKQKEVRQVIFENNLSVFAILESHASDSKLVKLCTYVFPHWDWTSNGNWCSKGIVFNVVLAWNNLLMFRLSPQDASAHSEKVDGAAVALPLKLWKDEIKSAPLWVKLHHVPIVAYSEVGLSLISTQIGKPIMMDSYTSNMCVSSWGRSTYTRVLIEVSAVNDLMDSMVLAIPLSNGKGHTFATVEIEYECRPPRCSVCEIFDHNSDKCPKNSKAEVVKEYNDGFTEVKRKKNKPKQNGKPRHVDGIRLSKPTPNFYYRKVEKGETSKVAAKDDKIVEKSNEQVSQREEEGFTSSMAASNEVQLKNSFSSLGDEESDWE
ncbi:zinc knuckle CX2CX4HX4C containing protein [Tanacetum coccineum]